MMGCECSVVFGGRHAGNFPPLGLELTLEHRCCASRTSIGTQFFLCVSESDQENGIVDE
jgi:hypothetical protein